MRHLVLQFVGAAMALSVLLRGFSPGMAAWWPRIPGAPSSSAWPPLWAGGWDCSGTMMLYGDMYILICNLNACEGSMKSQTRPGWWYLLIRTSGRISTGLMIIFHERWLKIVSRAYQFVFLESRFGFTVLSTRRIMSSLQRSSKQSTNRGNNSTNWLWETEHSM